MLTAPAAYLPDEPPQAVARSLRRRRPSIFAFISGAGQSSSSHWGCGAPGPLTGHCRVHERYHPGAGSHEANLVHPLIRGEDVSRWKASASTYIIVPQDPVRRIGFQIEEMQRSYRRTYSYFRLFEAPLRARSGYRKYFKGTGPFGGGSV
jgi:hypothetical protein